MQRHINHQVTLKPQDLVVLLKLVIDKKKQPYAALANGLHMSASEVHASLKRLQLARLVQRADADGLAVVRPATLEFVLFGARYAFPPIDGPPTRGIPTAYAGPALRDQIMSSADAVPVWPSSKGTTRGNTLHPLYPSVPSAAQEDAELYEVLTLFDALRIGAARERQLAADILTKKLQ